jgi:ABC-type spermidine/putrescine transport system permease subunit I
MELQKDNSPVSDKQGEMDKSERSPLRLFILLLLMAFCMLFYYFGELVDWAAWDVLRVNFFYGVHDIHRLLFLAPIVYSAYYFGMRATVIVTIITLMTFLPRALFISPYPDPLLRMILFTVVAWTIGHLVALVRREQKRCIRLKEMLKEKLENTGSSGQPD